MISKTLVIVNKLGLHARASSKLVELANNYSADITLSKNGHQANAKSIMTVMMLAASRGSTITISASGIDEVAAVDALVNLIQDKFGEEE